jgi:hypothetical protein
LTPQPHDIVKGGESANSSGEAGAPGLDPEYIAALAASERIADEPELRHGAYPRAHPVEVFGRKDGLDIAFIFDGQEQRLPDSVFEHAAVEVGYQCGKEVTAEDYASGAVFFLTALRRAGWDISPSSGCDPSFDMLGSGT